MNFDLQRMEVLQANTGRIDFWREGSNFGQLLFLQNPLRIFYPTHFLQKMEISSVTGHVERSFTISGERSVRPDLERFLYKVCVI